MKNISLKILSIGVLLSTATLVFAQSDDSATLNQIAGYRQWVRANPQAVVVSSIGAVQI